MVISMLSLMVLVFVWISIYLFDALHGLVPLKLMFNLVFLDTSTFLILLASLLMGYLPRFYSYIS